MKPIRKQDVFSIPNLLSCLRLVLIPVFLWIYLSAESPQDYYLAALVILISGITDALDGLIARKCNMVTEFGKMLDPIADKLTQVAIVLGLAARFEGMFILFIILAVKETFMGVNGLILLRKGKKLDGAMWFGKVSTAVLYGTMFILIALPEIPVSAATALMLLSGFFLVLSFVLYLPVYWKMYQEVRQESSKQKKV
ncbi:MAG TPA: CDP-alcohol phosphatidyltransferase family protein [Firmicutes bacterium]|nr:CDP-alcohol phosphatidyltransferase family protein [Bacillota bacterium]